MMNGKKRRWEPAVTAAELTKGNHLPKQGRKDETDKTMDEKHKAYNKLRDKTLEAGSKSLMED